MYKLIIESGIGDYLTDDDGKVYEVTGVTVSIYLDEETYEEKAHVLFEAVDSMNPDGERVLLDSLTVYPATMEEIEEYLGVFNELEFDYEDSEFSSEEFPELIQRRIQERVSNSADLELQNFFNEIEENERSKKIKMANNAREKEINKLDKINKILDEYLDYDNMIEKLGDPDGKYSEHIYFLKQEFKNECIGS